MRRLAVLVAWLFATTFAHADDGVWLVLDSTAYRPFGALAHLPHQEVREDGIVPRWTDPERSGGAMIVPVLVGAMVNVYAHDPVPGWRLESMQPITDAMARDGVLRQRLNATTVAVLAENGLTARHFTEVSEPGRGHLRQLGDRAGEPALVVQRDGSPLLQLSWDDRQLLVAAKFRRFEPSGTLAQPERERSLRRVRYIGAPIENDIPMERWAADDAALFLARTERAWAALLAEGLQPQPDLPKVKRGDSVRLRVAGRDQTFAGRLWKEEGGLAYVATHDGGVSLVELGE